MPSDFQDPLDLDLTHRRAAGLGLPRADQKGGATETVVIAVGALSTSFGHNFAMRRHAPGLLLASLRALACFVVLAPAAPLPADTFVTSGDKILVYYNFDSGDQAPKGEISGLLTGLDTPIALALDLVHRELWVVGLDPAVLVFDMDVMGNVAPVRKIEGASTGLVAPRGVMIDLLHDEVLVTDFQTNSVRAFARTADGNQAPLRTLTGAATGLNGPVLGFLDLVHDELVVPNYSAAPRIAFFARTASGDTAPLRTIEGNLSGVSNPRSTIVNLHTDRVVVSDYDQWAIRVYQRSVGGNVGFTGELAGALTELQSPYQIVLTDYGEAVIGTDTAVNARVVVHSLTSSGNVAPARVLTGPATLLANPTGVASDFARECAWGNSVDGCLFRDNFESSLLCYWSTVQGGPGCV